MRLLDFTDAVGKGVDQVAVDFVDVEAIRFQLLLLLGFFRFNCQHVQRVKDHLHFSLWPSHYHSDYESTRSLERLICSVILREQRVYLLVSSFLLVSQLILIYEFTDAPAFLEAPDPLNQVEEAVHY